MLKVKITGAVAETPVAPLAGIDETSISCAHVDEGLKQHVNEIKIPTARTREYKKAFMHKSGLRLFRQNRMNTSMKLMSVQTRNELATRGYETYCWAHNA